jgi:hypothetical protein
MVRQERVSGITHGIPRFFILLSEKKSVISFIKIQEQHKEIPCTSGISCQNQFSGRESDR